MMLNQKIAAIKKKRGSSYKPRTRHLMADGSAKYTNRLFLESSPYLLQHAHNPVNWYPWGDEVFETAKKLNRPVFVSIGYSTCHWCHVMEEESFEDEAIAEFINNHFIPVKVDREELPDVDSVYMSAVQLMTGGGGWPLNVWLTPDRVPFYGGTYFPPRDGVRGTLTGFLSILARIRTLYSTRHDEILSAGERLVHQMNLSLTPVAGSGLPDESLIESAVDSFERIYDTENGGTLSAPKFPSTLNIRFLLRNWKRTGRQSSLEMASHTLKKMAEGGIYDHVGGGFHRYATDSKWLVPHFEKMLYDNALLAMTYLEGWQATGDLFFQNITREILDYVEREMSSDEGGFYSASDADTLTPSGEKQEGYFFTWTPDELKSVLDTKDYAILKSYYSIGNTPDFEGRHILHMTKSPDIIAAEFGLNVKKLNDKITAMKALLYKRRQQKIPPFTDTKILTAWNGLMISAFARAGLSLDDRHYSEIAEKAAEFILSHLVKEERLFRIYKDKVAKHKAYLDDYAFIVAAFIDIYEATGEREWLNNAIFFNSLMLKLFYDKSTGGFFMTSNEHDPLPAREKSCYDGAVPSGNAIAVLNMLRLYSFTKETDYLNHAEKNLIAFSGQIGQNPAAGTEMLIALDGYYNR